MQRHEAIVYLKRLDHFGEPAIATGKRRVAETGETEIEVRLIHCVHGGDRTTWIRRDNI